jgi:hypothetical protein
LDYEHEDEKKILYVGGTVCFGWIDLDYVLVIDIDYRCEDGSLTVSSSCVAISNLDLISSSETGIHPGIRS